MNWGEVAMWTLTLAVLSLTVVLYVRVNIHDLGMVGFTIMLFGASVLLTSWVMAVYGWGDSGDSLAILWRGLVLIGAPRAIGGYLAGFIREPPPARQVTARLFVLVMLITLVLGVVR